MKVESALAPSISAASFCSSSCDCSAVSRMRVANGSHCQATIRITANNGTSLNQSIGVAAQRASRSRRTVRTPDASSRFFQTSALTVGITKNGAITIKRTMLRPTTCWSSSSASGVPSRMVMASTEPTSTSVFRSAVRKAGSVRKYRKFSSPTKLQFSGVEQAVVQRREIDRHGQRDDHPDEQQCDGRRQQSPSEDLGLLRRHRRLRLSLERGDVGCRPAARAGRQPEIGAARYLI